MFKSIFNSFHSINVVFFNFFKLRRNRIIVNFVVGIIIPFFISYITFDLYIQNGKLLKENLLMNGNITLVQKAKKYDEQITTLSDNIINLKLGLYNLEQEENNLKVEYDNLVSEYNHLINEGSIFLNNAATMLQFPNYPTGCESVSLWILLNYYGVNITVDDIINNLDKGQAPYYEAGRRYGGNPEIEFLGDPRNWTSYGVYEKPIMKVAERFKEGIISLKGQSLNDILLKVAQGNPVQVWVSLNIRSAYYSGAWVYKPTNEVIYWPDGFHSLVIAGFNKTQVIVSDPDTGTFRYFDRIQFERVYDFFGRRAIYYDE